MKSRTPWILATIFLSLFCLFSLFIVFVFALRSASDSLEGSGDIAVVEVRGPIFDSKKIVQQLDRIENNEHIHGLLLRIDSPGGSVGASQEIYQAVKRVAKKKKVVASMGSVAASGGYYVAVGADKIVANPGTLTGSIGVLMDYTNVEGLLKFLKIHAELLTAGEMKDAGSALKPLSEKDREYLQSILDNLHEQFKNAVGENRNLQKEQMDSLGNGQVFTGAQALQLGLIDQLGNQQDAVDLLAEMLGIKGKPKLIYPRKEKIHYLDLLTSGELENRLLNGVYSLREKRMMYLTKGIYQ